MLSEQITEDTCEEHGVFCCPACFDMSHVEVIVAEPGTPLAEALLRLQEAFKGFPWCKCEAGDDDHHDVVYFENQHEVSHGWKCRTCDGVVQVG